MVPGEALGERVGEACLLPWSSAWIHGKELRRCLRSSKPASRPANSQIAANVYAPTSAIAMSAPATIFGSLFVRALQQAAPLVIHYDEDVQRSDVGCFQ